MPSATPLQHAGPPRSSSSAKSVSEHSDVNSKTLEDDRPENDEKSNVQGLAADTEVAIPSPQPESPAPVVQLSKARLVLIAAIVTCVMTLGAANAMALNIALPNIQLELGMSPTELQWIVSVYTLTNACFLLLAGRLADIHGRKMMFVGGIAWLAVFTLGGGFVKTGVALIVVRAISGIGVSMSTPSAIGLIASYYTGRARTFAFSAFAAGAPAGSVIGLVLGGVITSYTAQTWRVILWLLGSVTIVVAIGAYFLIPNQPAKPTDRRIDWIGGALVTVGLVCVMFVVSDGSTAPQGWATSYIIALLIIGVLTLVAFGFWEHHITKRQMMPPLIRLTLFTQSRGKLSAVYFIGFVCWMGFSSLLYHATLFYQQVQDTGPIGAMYRFLPSAISGILCNVVVAYVVNRYKTQYIICIGVCCTGVANVLFAVAPKDGSYWALPFNGMWLSVVGVDFLMSTGSIFVAALARPEEQSVAGAVSQTLIRLGGSFGVASTTALATAWTERSTSLGVAPVDALTDGLHAAFWLGAGFSFSALFIAVFMLRGLGVISKDKKPAEVEPEKRNDIESGHVSSSDEKR